MGADIALVLALAGVAVTLLDISNDQLALAQTRMETSAATLVENDIIDQEQVSQGLQAVSGTLDLTAAIKDSDFVVETVFEDLAVKQQVFAALDAEAPPEAILASNTSSLSITALGAATRRPDRVVGSHFILPGTVLPLVEVVRGDQTSDETMRATYDLWQRVGKQPVMVQKDIPGFIHNRLQHALSREAISLWASGVATAEEIDAVVVNGFGLRLGRVGPLAQRDLGGMVMNVAIAATLYPTLSNLTDAPQVMKDLVEQGDTGLEAGRGFHDWSDSDASATRRQVERNLLADLLHRDRS
jgi:3-hydroxyacyl-CoA dehydrogenase